MPYVNRFQGQWVPAGWIWQFPVKPQLKQCKAMHRITLWEMHLSLQCTAALVVHVLTDLSGSLLHGPSCLALAHSSLKLLDITSKMAWHTAIRGSQVIPVTCSWKRLEQMADKKFCDIRRIGKKTISTAHVHPTSYISPHLENATKIADASSSASRDKKVMWLNWRCLSTC